MNQDQLEKVIQKLNGKNLSQACARCSSVNFTVAGESEIKVAKPAPLNRGIGLGSIPSRISMPTIVVVCDNCGYVTQHALAGLIK